MPAVLINDTYRPNPPSNSRLQICPSTVPRYTHAHPRELRFISFLSQSHLSFHVYLVFLPNFNFFHVNLFYFLSLMLRRSNCSHAKLHVITRCWFNSSTPFKVFFSTPSHTFNPVDVSNRYTLCKQERVCRCVLHFSGRFLSQVLPSGEGRARSRPAFIYKEPRQLPPSQS